jgi:beta-glucosidase
VIVVVVAGRPLVMNRQLDNADGALMAFLPGSEGGAAIASSLFGAYNPSGRLTVSWPRSSDQLPLAYNEPGRPYHPRYPFGYGLSYSRFGVSDLSVPDSVSRNGRVTFALDLRNRSSRGGDHVLLAFVDGRLAAFERERVGGGDSERVRMAFDASGLAPGRHRLKVGDETKTFRVR